MGAIDKLKGKVGNYALNRKLKDLKRNVKACNIDKAKSIGIVFNASQPVSFDIVRELAKEFDGKKHQLQVLGYFNNTEVFDHYLYRKNFEFFTPKEINWYRKPSGDVVDNFINTKFDILFDLSIKDNFSLHYIVSTSAAHFKVGKYNEGATHLDFMISLEQEKIALKGLKSEVQKEKKNKKNGSLSGNGNLSDSSVELELNFLIHELMHYLKLIKN